MTVKDKMFFVHFLYSRAFLFSLEYKISRIASLSLAMTELFSYFTYSTLTLHSSPFTYLAFHPFNLSTNSTPHPCPLPQGVREKTFNTLTLSHTAYSLTRLILRLFELASRKGRGKSFRQNLFIFLNQSLDYQSFL